MLQNIYVILNHGYQIRADVRIILSVEMYKNNSISLFHFCYKQQALSLGDKKNHWKLDDCIWIL